MGGRGERGRHGCYTITGTYDVGQCQVGLWWKRGRTGEGPVQRLGAGIGLYYKIRYNL